ncbi:MAG TPA: PIG-L family deacetylase [Actinomadura sp.]|nr:PIG-L family deacetylase [Actinomadura sp.]
MSDLPETGLAETGLSEAGLTGTGLSGTGLWETEPGLIDAPGTDEAEWRRWPGLAALAEVDPGAWRRVVVVAAHPDDEILGVGGTMALLAATGARIRLIAVTDGEASHPGLGPRAAAALAARRVAETTAALDRLGASGTEVIRLGLPDTGLSRHESDLADTLGPAMEGFDIALAPWSGDAHADHEAAGRAAARARGTARLLHFPIWAWHWARAADPRLPWDTAVRVPLSRAAAARKRAAIGCFGSQLEPRGRGLDAVLPPGIVAHFTRDQEVLFR